MLKFLSKKKEIRKHRGVIQFRLNQQRCEDNKDKTPIITAKAPEIFCIQQNTEDTLKFFNEIIEIYTKHVVDVILFIDISDITYVGVDALMYLLATIHNVKSSPNVNIRIQGNFPRDRVIRRQFVDSGFLSYVYTDRTNIESSSKNISIQTGQLNDPNIAAKVCDFVQEACYMTKKETIPLYNILIELMGNTNQHAYRDDSKDENDPQTIGNWYLYAEENKNDITFVFLDTGAGIPATVRKTIMEKFKEMLPFVDKYSDADYIYSALKGEFRTETRLRHRGRGLPQIAEYCVGGVFNKVSIHAGNGHCYTRSDNKFYKRDLSIHMRGTLFTWVINKRRNLL